MLTGDKSNEQHWHREAPGGDRLHRCPYAVPSPAVAVRGGHQQRQFFLHSTLTTTINDLKLVDLRSSVTVVIMLVLKH